MFNDLKTYFPNFWKNIEKLDIEDELDAITEEGILELEKNLGIVLPPSYKQFLLCTQGFEAFGGMVQLGEQHPFFHKFKSLNELTPQQQKMVKQKGGIWPPPSNGMLCFAEFFMEADGDQVLFDVSQKDENGEYPVYYYAHDSRPPEVRKIAGSFGQWLNEFPDYKEFADE